MKDTSGETLGTIKVGGETLSTEFADYTLTLTGSTLAVTVGVNVIPDTGAPVVTKVEADIVTTTRQDVTVTLWFASGSMDNWDADTRTYSDGENSVTVSGVSADQVTLRFGIGESVVSVELYNNGAFSEFASQKIFEESDNGLLAGLS